MIYISDELIEEAYDKEWISDWDRTFLLGLIDYASLSQKQEDKLTAIKVKIERKQNQKQKRAIPVRSGSSFTQAVAQAAIAHGSCPHCPNCGHEL